MTNHDATPAESRGYQERIDWDESTDVAGGTIFALKLVASLYIAVVVGAVVWLLVVTQWATYPRFVPAPRGSRRRQSR